MKPNIRIALWITLWGILGLIVLMAAWLGYLSLRYSPGYVYKEVFMNLGTPYDYRVLPERKLSASPNPFMFAEDASRATLVQETFQTAFKNTALDDFLKGTGTQAFLIIQNDAIIYERYFMGYRRDSIVTSFSVAKSFDSALIGIAIQEGYIKSVDDPITDYIPELSERDPRFKDIQLRHLLMMTSGLRYNTNRYSSLGDDNLTYGFDDMRHLVLTETEVIEAPGATFVYNDYNPLLLGLILERATGKPVTTYLQEKLWTPLGMEFDGSWSLDSEKSQFEMMESGINARAIDFVKLGRLYLHGGDWNGTQVVPSNWVAASLQDNGMIEDEQFYYGYMWWGERCNPESQDFFAQGNFGQYIYISPAKDMIIVRNGEEYGLPGDRDWPEVLCRFARSMP